MTRAAAVRKHLTVTEFDRNSQAVVTLDGQPVATLTRTPGFIYAETLGTPWGGGRTLTNALKSVAVAYVQLHG